MHRMKEKKKKKEMTVFVFEDSGCCLQTNKQVCHISSETIFFFFSFEDEEKKKKILGENDNFVALQTYFTDFYRPLSLFEV